MIGKAATAALMVATLTLGIGIGAGFSRTAQAEVGPSSSTSCGTSTPCLTEENTASGPGVKSTSAHGAGLVATTKATGSTPTNGASAVLGQDLQTGSGKGGFNFGVSGTSMFGAGLFGSGAVGVLASTTNPNGTLFAGLGSPVGSGFPSFSVAANGSATFGGPSTSTQSAGITVNHYCGDNGFMFDGNTQDGKLFSVDGCGDVFAQLLGAASIETGSFLSDDGLGSIGKGTGGVNYAAVDTNGVTWLYQGYSDTAGKYTVEMGDSGSVYARVFITMNDLRVAQQTASGTRVDTYATQATQPSLDDFGEGQLVDGSATVALDPKFATAIDDSVRYYVMLTPEGDCRGLYVAQRTPTSFTVRELQDGRSSIPFTYRIVAKPFGDDSARLPQSTVPYGMDHKVPAPIMHVAPRRIPHHPPLH